MRFISSSLAMLALMAIETHSFTVTSPLKAAAPLRMSSYDEQLRAYQQQPPPAHASPPANGAVSPIPTNPNPYPAAPASAAATANGAEDAASIIAAAAAAAATEALNNRYQQLPPPVPAPAPVAPVVSTPPPAPVAVTETATATATATPELNNPLGNFGTLFLGLPLWLILSYAVFFNNPVINNAPPQITAANQIVLPDSIAKSAASPSGVVVLSQPITKAEVRGLFDLWNDALATGDPATVAKRYGKDGVLLPTLSDVPRTDVEGIKDYFVGFLKKRPVGKILEGEIYVGNNWAQDAGKKNER